MASEYLKWKAREEKPAPPPKPLTGREKRLNWLRYHYGWLIAAAAVLWILGSMLWGVFGRTKPDYIFAWIGREPLPAETAAALETGLASLGSDVNGDGRVTVELRQYATDRSGEAETALYYNYSADTQLLADITAGDSYFFLTEDPEGVQRAYQIFAAPDGSPPAEDDFSAADKVFLWDDSPALESLGIEGASGLWIGRRCFYEEKQLALHESDAALWALMTGAGTP